MEVQGSASKECTSWAGSLAGQGTAETIQTPGIVGKINQSEKPQAMAGRVGLTAGDMPRDV